MPLQIPRLRRWLALAALMLLLAVAGVYLHRRRQARSVFKQIPARMNVEIQQTAEGFKVSKSEQGHTLFTIEARRAVQFKKGGRAELHNVTITLYGRDASRYDQIYGDNFSYDPLTGDVKATGEVRIDLEANPAGLLSPDQSKPEVMKNPIHLVTRDLVFNQKTGNAFTNAKVDLRMPQATGSASGVRYTARDNLLTLDSGVELAMTGVTAAQLKAARAWITKDPRQVVLERARLTQGRQQLEAGKTTLYLREDNTVDHVVATEGIQAHMGGESPIRARARQADFTLNEAQDGLSRAVFREDVQVEAAGDHPSQVNAGRVVLDFTARNAVSKIRAEEGVKLTQVSARAAGGAIGVSSVPAGEGARRSTGMAQRVEVTAPAIDFFMAKGKHLDHAEAIAPASIAILPSANAGASTIVTAGKFEAKFDDQGRLNRVHGSPDAKVLNRTPGQPDRISTSQQIDATFRPAGGINAIVQQGDVTYSDGERQAHADQARYTPADEILELSGSPRITDKGLTTTAHTLRMNRLTGDASAEGSVKSTYSELREQPDGALLAGASPIHVTSRNVTLNRSSAMATYTGDARLWQDANVVEAQSIQFDREHRSVVAQGNGRPVSTVLVEVDKHGKATPVTITSSRLTYTDDQRRARFEGGVAARGADVTITSDHLDAVLAPRSQSSQHQSVKGQGQLERLVAEGNVIILQPGRQAAGRQLAYTIAEDKFVLSGGPASIFDAEHGKIRGDSLTFFRRDDRVLVEGSDSSPTVTQTRVAR